MEDHTAERKLYEGFYVQQSCVHIIVIIVKLLYRVTLYSKTTILITSNSENDIVPQILFMLLLQNKTLIIRIPVNAVMSINFFILTSLETAQFYRIIANHEDVRGLIGKFYFVMKTKLILLEIL